MTINLSKGEIESLLSAASQMEDDFYDWCYDTAEAKTVQGKVDEAKIKSKNFKSALNKLRVKLQTK